MYLQCFVGAAKNKCKIYYADAELDYTIFVLEDSKQHLRASRLETQHSIMEREDFFFSLHGTSRNPIFIRRHVAMRVPSYCNALSAGRREIAGPQLRTSRIRFIQIAYTIMRRLNSPRSMFCYIGGGRVRATHKVRSGPEHHRYRSKKFNSTDRSSWANELIPRNTPRCVALLTYISDMRLT